MSRKRLKMSRTYKEKKKKKYLQLLRSAFPHRQTFQMRHLNLEALNEERYQLPLQALTKERKQRKRKASMMMIQLLHLRKLQPWYGMVKTFQEMKRIQFSENYPNVFLIVTIQSGQVFTTKDFQHSQTTGICSGIRSIDKPTNHTT